METLSLVSINFHVCWPGEWTHVFDIWKIHYERQPMVSNTLNTRQNILYTSAQNTFRRCRVFFNLRFTRQPFSKKLSCYVLLNYSCGCCSLNSFLLQVRQKSHLFAFGAAVNSNLLLKKPEYRDFYLKNFQWAVLESALKWRNIEPTPVSYEISIYFRNVWLWSLFIS